MSEDAKEPLRFPITIALSKPVTIGNAITVTELNIKREPVLGDMYTIDFTPGQNALKQMAALAVILTGESSLVISNLCLKDARKLTRQIEILISPFLEIGDE
jgi:hypothetical protein